MSATTPTTTNSTAPSVPSEVHLTNDQTHILSLLRSTKLRISLITAGIRAVRQEAAMLELLLPPLEGRTPNAMAMELMMASSRERMGASAARTTEGEDVVDKPAFDLTWRCLRLTQVLGRAEGLEKEAAEHQEKKEWLEGAYAQTVEHEERKKMGLEVAAEPEKRPVFDWERLEVGWELTPSHLASAVYNRALLLRAKPLPTYAADSRAWIQVRGNSLYEHRQDDEKGDDGEEGGGEHKEMKREEKEEKTTYGYTVYTTPPPPHLETFHLPRDV
ncbi:hypothetical protein EKO04_011414 [Ascochyta lentis]|uniref:Uncharacterized protein n=1 Tax=Ascochyta lentis TaxID=205686 RepID=A0A8H7MDD5_9PLEO|nr:hypothetical protein EKO04_011414 [Ascochyta lentis]